MDNTQQIQSTIPNALVALMTVCETMGLSLDMSYTHGQYISGEFFDLPEQEQNKHVQQGPKGWSIVVSGYFYQNEITKKEMLYPTIKAMVNAGMDLIKDVLNKKDKENQDGKQTEHE